MINWLVTWESWSDSKVKKKDKYSAILDGNLSAGEVCKIVELLYVNHECNIGERLQYANGKYNPYPAKVSELKEVPGESEIICGHDPYLCARRVTNCQVKGEGSNEKLSYD